MSESIEKITDPDKIPKRFPPLNVVGTSHTDLIIRINQLSSWANITDHVLNRLVDNFSALLFKLTGRR